MKAVLKKMDPSEHCPGCGALLVIDRGVSVCAACGFYSWEGEKMRVEDKKTMGRLARRLPSHT